MRYRIGFVARVRVFPGRIFLKGAPGGDTELFLCARRLSRRIDDFFSPILACARVLGWARKHPCLRTIVCFFCPAFLVGSRPSLIETSGMGIAASREYHGIVEGGARTDTLAHKVCLVFNSDSEFEILIPFPQITCINAQVTIVAVNCQSFLFRSSGRVLSMVAAGSRVLNRASQPSRHRGPSRWVPRAAGGMMMRSPAATAAHTAARFEPHLACAADRVYHLLT